MGRDGISIFMDDDSSDLKTFMLNALGIDLMDFSANEHILTKEHIESNYETLLKMVDVRSRRNSSFFVLAYFILVSGAELPDDLRDTLLERTHWKHEKNIYQRDFEIARQIYIKDFREKIKRHKRGIRLHPMNWAYNSEDVSEGLLVGVDQVNNWAINSRTSEIQHINLDGWDLEEIPEEVFEFKKLKSLRASYNRLTEIPKKITELKQLCVLGLCYNKIGKIPDYISELSSIESITLDNNEISTLPESLSTLQNLEELYIRMNQITEIPESLSSARFKIKYYYWGYDPNEHVYDTVSKKEYNRLRAVHDINLQKITKQHRSREELRIIERFKRRVKGLINLHGAIPVKRLSLALEITEVDAENLIYELMNKGINGELKDSVFYFDNPQEEVTTIINQFIDEQFV